MQKNQTSNKVHQRYRTALLNTVLQFDGLADLSLFFDDLFTKAELQAISERWQVAQLLHQGLTQRDVAKQLNVSVSTVTRVAHCLVNDKGGYRLALEN